MSGLGDAAAPGLPKGRQLRLSAQEQTAGCRELQERKVSVQQQLEALPAQAVQQMQELPTTVANAWGRLVGTPDQGVPALAEYNEAKAEAAALNESMSRKGCGPRSRPRQSSTNGRQCALGHAGQRAQRVGIRAPAGRYELARIDHERSRQPLPHIAAAEQLERQLEQRQRDRKETRRPAQAIA